MRKIIHSGLRTGSKILRSERPYKGGGKPHYKYFHGTAALLFKTNRKRYCRGCGGDITDLNIVRVYCIPCANLRGNTPATRQRAAHQKVFAAIQAGKLAKLDGSIECVDCGAVAVNYDHRDYNNPLDVVPVCRSCNHGRGRAKPVII